MRNLAGGEHVSPSPDEVDHTDANWRMILTVAASRIRDEDGEKPPAIASMIFDDDTEAMQRHCAHGILGLMLTAIFPEQDIPSNVEDIIRRLAHRGVGVSLKIYQPSNF